MHYSYRIMTKEQLDKYLPGFTRSKMYESLKSKIEPLLGTIIDDRDAICCLNSNDAIVTLKDKNVEVSSQVILKCDDGCGEWLYHNWKLTPGVSYIQYEKYETSKKEEKPKENTIKLSDKLFRRRKIVLNTSS